MHAIFVLLITVVALFEAPQNLLVFLQTMCSSRKPYLFEPLGFPEPLLNT